MEKEIRKIFITGASGFIGKRFLRILNPEDQYFILTRKNVSEWNNLPTNIRIVQGDLEKLDILNFNQPIDIIVNMAAELKDESKMVKTNIDGVNSLCRFADKTGVKKIIHLSSVGVIGAQFSSSKRIINENSESRPINSYEKTKLKSEEIVLNFARKRKIELVILRPTNVFGDGHPKNVLLNLFNRINQNQKFPLVKDAMVNYLYVDDLVSIMQYCMDNKMQNTVYTIGNSHYLELFVTQISANLGKHVRFFKIPKFFINLLELFKYLGMNKTKTNLRNVSNRIEYDGSLILNESGLKYHLKEGIEKTIIYYKKTGLLK